MKMNEQLETKLKKLGWVSPKDAADIGTNLGVCFKCASHYHHHGDEPVASCKCHSSEWYNMTPLMLVEKELDIAIEIIEDSGCDYNEVVERYMEEDGD